MRAWLLIQIICCCAGVSAQSARSGGRYRYAAAFRRVGLCSRAQRRRGCSKTKWLCLPPNKLCPPRPRGVAWTILWRPFSRGRRILRSCVGSGARTRTIWKASGCWGSLKAPGNTTSWPCHQRISTASHCASLASPVRPFMCSSMAQPLSPKHMHPACTAATPPPRRRRPLLLRRQGRLRVVAGALRRAGQHNFRI